MSVNFYFLVVLIRSIKGAMERFHWMLSKKGQMMCMIFCVVTKRCLRQLKKVMLKKFGKSLSLQLLIVAMFEDVFQHRCIWPAKVGLL
ncbi:unnamed protein product [Onchocerca flexuosa]|uniref:Secreted protein n=1 Tax=Onchocerca flexuosa TaxID=387005 RepID=A0A183HHW8_9BILA|nr:unnamed protein product [Onchocerca flexuosa]